MTGPNETMQGDAALMMFEPNHPYATPGQVCDDVAGKRTGPCSNEPFAKYAQCSLPAMYTRVALKMTVAAPGAPIVIAPLVTTPLRMFTTGAGGASPDQGYPVALNGGQLTSADTSVVGANQNNAGLAPDNTLTYRIHGFNQGFQEFFEVSGGLKLYGTPFLKYYTDLLSRILLTELVTTAKFGGTTVEQLLGTPALWRPSNFRDNNPESGKPTWIRCQWLTGGPNDSDKLKMEVTLPAGFSVANDPGSPTVPGEYFAQLVTNAFGQLECRNEQGMCPSPESKQISNAERELAVLKQEFADLKAALRARG